MNTYKVDIEVNGTVRRTVVSANTRGDAYRFVTTAFPTCEVIDIYLVRI